MARKKNGKIGSSFDGFLAGEGILAPCEEQALKQILADQIKAAMEKDSLSKSAMAARMQTSRRALQDCPTFDRRKRPMSLSFVPAAILHK